MKTAIYIEGGVVQLVLTPESEWEKSAINSFRGKETKAQIFDGTFYDCRGGWTRQSEVFAHNHYYGDGLNDRSLILRVETK